MKLQQLTKNRMVLATGSMLMAGVLCFGIAPAYQQMQQEAVPILVVTEEIEKGTQISEQQLKQVEIPKQYLPDGVVGQPQQANGKYAAVDLQVGDWLTQNKLSDTTDLQSWYTKLRANQVAVSVSIKTLAAGVSAQLQAGDIISFVSANSDADTVILPQLQYLEVLAVSTPSATEYQTQTEEEQELPATVTVLATPEQAKILADQDLNSNLHAVLVSRGNPEQAQTLLQQQAEILQQEVQHG